LKVVAVVIMVIPLTSMSTLYHCFVLIETNVVPKILVLIVQMACVTTLTEVLHAIQPLPHRPLQQLLQRNQPPPRQLQVTTLSVIALTVLQLDSVAQLMV
jgi:hypothetical protein